MEWKKLSLTNFDGVNVDFGNGEVIESHTLLDMWLLIHAEIKVNPH